MNNRRLFASITRYHNVMIKFFLNKVMILALTYLNKNIFFPSWLKINYTQFFQSSYTAVNLTNSQWLSDRNCNANIRPGKTLGCCTAVFNYAATLTVDDDCVCVRTGAITAISVTSSDFMTARHRSIKRNQRKKCDLIQIKTLHNNGDVNFFSWILIRV